MKILGLDIGTATVSAVVWQNGAVIDSVTKKNGKCNAVRFRNPTCKK